MKNHHGFVYLIHFHEAMAHTQHYIGWAKNLSRRIGDHRETFWQPADPYQTEKYGTAIGCREGRGATLLGVANYRGIGWEVARVWKGDRDLEKRIKDGHARHKYCPICHPDHAWLRGLWAPKGRLPRLRASAIVQSEPIPAWWPRFMAADLTIDPAPIEAQPEELYIAF